MSDPKDPKVDPKRRAAISKALDAFLDLYSPAMRTLAERDRHDR